MSEDPEQEQFRQKVQQQIKCPLSKDIMEDPVIDKEGNSYERQYITTWLNTPGRRKESPITRNPLRLRDLKQNHSLRTIIQKFENGTINLNNGPLDQFFDPQTGDLMTDPVIDSNGFSRERRRPSDVDNRSLKKIIQAYQQTARKKQQRERRQRQQKRRRQDQMNIQNQRPVRARDHQMDIQNQRPVRARDHQMDIQNQPLVRARDHQMNIQNQVHQARRARQIAQRQARQEERQRLEQQITRRIGEQFTNNKEKQVDELLKNLSRVASPETHQRYLNATYEWKAVAGKSAIRRRTGEEFTENKYKALKDIVKFLEESQQHLVASEHEEYKKMLNDWKGKYLEKEIEKIITSPFTEHREKQVIELLNQLQSVVKPEIYQNDKTVVYNWKGKYLENEIEKIIKLPFTEHREKQVIKLLNQLQSVVKPEIYQNDKTVVYNWKGKYLENELEKIIKLPFTEHREKQVIELLNKLKLVASPEIYQHDKKVVFEWKARYLKDEINKIIRDPFTEHREARVKDLLEQLNRIANPEYEHYKNLAIEWKNSPPNPRNLQVVRSIGGGGFGKTYLVKDMTTNKEYIRKEGINTYGNGNQNMQYQYKNLEYLKDKGICNKGFICPVLQYTNGGKVYILMDYLKGYKDIFDVLGRLTNDQKVDIGRQAILLMQRLHRNGIVHCDFKGNNVMYNEREGKVKVIDFGVSVQRNNGTDRHTLKIGGHPYTDKPNRNYGQSGNSYTWSQLIKKDYWGLGIFLYMLKYGRTILPFNTNNDTSYNRNAKNDELNTFYQTPYIVYFT